MIERRPLGRLAREPLYNTRAVVQTTTVPADTFRAWERRYGLPRPYRTSGNQRLYSERDIGVISWLRDRTTEGMTISQAIQRLKLEYPDLFLDQPESRTARQEDEPATEPWLVGLRERLLDALVSFDDPSAERVIDEALALLSLEGFCSRVVEPVMAEIGARWSRDELSVSAEHFATRLIERRLAALFTMVSPVVGRGTIVAACAPGEEHEVGLLVLSIFLARRNWRVIFLGANVPASDLVTTVRQMRPDLVCLSAATAQPAECAIDLARELRSVLLHPPPIVLGGHAFTTREPPQPRPGVRILNGHVSDVAGRIADIAERRGTHEVGTRNQ
ncbi:MAG: MerR family transcriptional regulator [Vicinamibacterales bacterium]